MKFNWGTGIFIFLIIFVSLAITFMIFAFNQEISLVHKNYYQKGVDYNNEISTGRISKKYYNSIKLITTNKNIELIFNDSIKHKSKNIEVYFYSPSKQNNDFRIKKADINNGFIIDRTKLIPGRYIINITWSMNNNKYKIKKEYINN